MDASCRELAADGFVTEEYQRILSERKALDGSVFEGVLAVPHAEGEFVRRDFVRIMQTIYDLVIKVFRSRRYLNAVMNAFDLDSLLDILMHT